MRWTPVDGLTVDLSYDQSKDENTPNYSQLINYNPNGYNVGTYDGATAPLRFNGTNCNAVTGTFPAVTTNPCIAPLSPLVGSQRRQAPEDGGNRRAAAGQRRSTNGFGGTVKYKVTPDLELRSITGYRQVGTHQWDNSGGAHRTAFAPNGNFSRYSLSELSSISSARNSRPSAASPTDRLCLGAYYFNEKVEEAAATPSTNRWNADGTGYTILRENGQRGPQPPYNCGNVTPLRVLRPFPPRAGIATTGASSVTAKPRPKATPVRPGDLDAGRFRHFPPDRWAALHQGQARRHPGHRSGKSARPAPRLRSVPVHYNKDRVDPLIVAAIDATPDLHFYAKYSTGYPRRRRQRPLGDLHRFRSGSRQGVRNWLEDGLLRSPRPLEPRGLLYEPTGTQTDFDNVDTNSDGNPTFNSTPRKPATRRACRKSRASRRT